jgi:hypothetical protein
MQTVAQSFKSFYMKGAFVYFRNIIDEITQKSKDYER